MPKYYEEVPEDDKPKRSCDGLREDLKTCLLSSDCVIKVNFQGCHSPVHSKSCVICFYSIYFRTMHMGERCNLENLRHFSQNPGCCIRTN